MSHSHSPKGSSIVLACLAVVLFAGPALAKKTGPSCRPGRFQLDPGPRLLPDHEPDTVEAIVVDEDRGFAVQNGCSAVLGKVSKRGAKLSASWPTGACKGITAKAKLSATLDATCDSLRGTFTVKRQKLKFTATRNEGVLLEGGDGDSAIGALVDLPPRPAAARADVVDRLILTRLDVGLTPDATVADVNAALHAVGGKIVAMRAGVPAVTIEIPRASGALELQGTADLLKSLPGISFALPGREPAPRVAPPAPANADRLIQHLADSLFPAAWNARSAAGDCARSSNKVKVLVADYLLRPPDARYSTVFSRHVPNVTQKGSGSAARGDHHGLDVLTTLAAKLDKTAPTGANPFPECLDVTALQINGLTIYATTAAIFAEVFGTTGKIVVNESFGFDDHCSGPPCDPTKLVTVPAADRAFYGILERKELLRDPINVLVSSAIGQIALDPIAAVYPGVTLAKFDSAVAVAVKADSSMSFASDPALWEATPGTCAPACPSLVASASDLAGIANALAGAGLTGVGQAQNALLVGSNQTLGSPSLDVNTGADVFATGENIPTLIGVTQGTSFAAPQVTGLASYLWMLSPDLRARPVADTITAISGNSANGQIDAYASVLSLDEATTVTPATAKIRLAILDVKQNDAFDADDLRAYHDAYVDSGLVLEPTVKDYSRFDLNGDGFTGGSVPARFDLEPTGSIRFGAAKLLKILEDIAGRLTEFDEQAVTDADILCFYAYSALYTGTNLQERDDILKDLCVPSGTLAGTVVVHAQGTQTFCRPVDGGQACSTRTVLSDDVWTVRLTPEANGTFQVTGTVTRNSLVRGESSAPGVPNCQSVDEQQGSGPVHDYTGDVLHPAGDLHATLTYNETRTSVCQGQLPSTHTDVSTEEVNIGEEADVVIQDGVLKELFWDQTLGNGPLDPFVRGSLTLVP